MIGCLRICCIEFSGQLKPRVAIGNRHRKDDRYRDVITLWYRTLTFYFYEKADSPKVGAEEGKTYDRKVSHDDFLFHLVRQSSFQCGKAIG